MVAQDFLNPPAGVKCLKALQDTIFKSALKCRMDSGFSFWVIQAPPTSTEITSICGSSTCRQLILAMRETAPTECVMSDGFFLYQDMLNPILKQCSSDIESANNLGIGSIVGIAIGCLVVFAILWCCCLRKICTNKNKQQQQQRQQQQQENPPTIANNRRNQHDYAQYDGVDLNTIRKNQPDYAQYDGVDLNTIIQSPSVYVTVEAGRTPPPVAKATERKYNSNSSHVATVTGSQWSWTKSSNDNNTGK